MSKKILKLYQANEDGATDINTQFTPVTIDGGVENITGGTEIDTGRTINGKKLYRYYPIYKPDLAPILDIMAGDIIPLPLDLKPILPKGSSLIDIQWHIINKYGGNTYKLLPINNGDDILSVDFQISEEMGDVTVLVNVISTKNGQFNLNILPGSYIEYIKNN